jgi:hypothetical protein
MKKILLALLLGFTITVAAQPTTTQYKADTAKSNARIRLLEWQAKRDSSDIATLKLQVAALVKNDAAKDVRLKALETSQWVDTTVFVASASDSLKGNMWRYNDLYGKAAALQKTVDGLTGTAIPKVEGRLTTVEGKVDKIPKSASSSTTTIFQY